VRSVLFVGDVTGNAGLEHVCRRVPQLREQRDIDAVVVNGENAAQDGIGMPYDAVTRMLNAGVDVITGGNHSWDHDDNPRCLGHPRVLRPLNVSSRYPGNGIVTLQRPSGRPLTVINAIDPDALGAVVDPLAIESMLDALERELSRHDLGDIVVDVHSAHVHSKQAIAYALDGRVAAVLGTHTHEATLRLRRLPHGTALVTDVGMTGCPDGVMGFTPDAFVRGLRRGSVIDGPAAPTDGPAELSAVLVGIDDSGHATRIERVT
jgi:metallophosphoesterase (TIGR00282 family)